MQKQMNARRENPVSCHGLPQGQKLFVLSRFTVQIASIVSQTICFVMVLGADLRNALFVKVSRSTVEKHVFFRCVRGNQNPKVLLLRIGGASYSGHSLTGIPIPDSWTLLTSFSDLCWAIPRDSCETHSWKLAGSVDCCLSDTRIASHV